MEDIFKPHSLTIKALFGNQDALYQIPRYQRPYSWGDEQLEKLWDDIMEAKESEPNYFLGSIITAKPQENSNYLDVVDGQQRLTTLLILLCVCRDLFPNLNHHILESDPFAIDNNIIKGSIKYNDRFERLRLITHSQHGSDFQNTVLNEGAAIQNEKPTKKQLRIEEASVYKFKNTASFFTEKLSVLGEEEAGEFINYLFNKVKIIRIDCHSVSFAIKLFQVLNDRGLDLSNADLIKSFLIGKIFKKYEIDEISKKQNEEKFMDDWKYCEHITEDTYESMNSFFTMYQYFLLAKNPEKSLSDELESLFETKDANDIIADFKKFVTLYKTDIYNREEPLMYSFFYLRWSMYWKTILLTSLHTKYPKHDELMFALRRFYYLNWFAGNTLTKIKQISFNLIGWIKEKKNIDFIKAEFEKSLKQDTIKRAIDNLNGDIYFESWCKPLLFLLEYNQQDNPMYLAMDDRNIQIEHILPRGYLKNSDWEYVYNIDNIGNWINSGANLTPLSGKKNLAASNDGLDKKILAYNGRGFHASSDNKITSFVITQFIVNDYNSNKFNKQWSIDAINDRWHWYCEQIEELFTIDLSEIKNQKLG